MIQLSYKNIIILYGPIDVFLALFGLRSYKFCARTKPNLHQQSNGTGESGTSGTVADSVSTTSGSVLGRRAVGGVSSGDSGDSSGGSENSSELHFLCV